MTFEFVVMCGYEQDTDIATTLADVLTEALSNNDNEFDEEDISRMIVPHKFRPAQDLTDEDGTIMHRALVGFQLELPEETCLPQIVLDEFVTMLRDTPAMMHVLKLEDPLLHKELTSRAKEIFVAGNEVEARTIIDLFVRLSKR